MLQASSMQRRTVSFQDEAWVKSCVYRMRLRKRGNSEAFCFEASDQYSIALAAQGRLGGDPEWFLGGDKLHRDFLDEVLQPVCAEDHSALL